MILNLFLSLLGIGMAANVNFKEQYRKVFSFILCCAAGMVFYRFFQQWQAGLNVPFVYHWLEYNALEVDINLSSNPFVYNAIFPVFMITMSALLINTFLNYETEKLEFVSAAVINLAFFIALICSENLIQLLISSTMVGVMGFYIINDIEAREKYVFYNFLADMGLFTVFAIIYGRLGNVFLTDLGSFAKLGAHRDLVAILLLISVFIKSGLFLFHNQLLDLSSINFNRLLLLIYASAPLAGVVILYKTMPLLKISHYSMPFIQIVAVLTMVWGFFNSLANDNIKDRSTYFAMMIYGYIYSLVSLGQLQTAEDLCPLIVLGYVLGLNMFMIYLSSSNELYVSKMGGFLKGLKITFMVSILVVFAYVQTILKDIDDVNYLWSTSLLSFGLISLAHFYHQVFLGRSQADERVLALLKNAGAYIILPVLLMSGFLIFHNNLLSKDILYVLSAFGILLLIQPFRSLVALAEYEALQDEDYFEKLYEAIILAPIKILGRILWLLVDFILIERTIISSLNESTSLLVRLTGRLHNSSLWSYLLLSLFGLVAMILFYFVKG